MTSNPLEEPYIEKPDEVQVGDELYCWMPGNYDRMCGGDCVAYDGSFTNDQTRDSCKLLNAVRSTAMSLALLTRQRQQAAVKDHIDRLPKPPEVK